MYKRNFSDMDTCAPFKNSIQLIAPFFLTFWAILLRMNYYRKLKPRCWERPVHYLCTLEPGRPGCVIYTRQNKLRVRPRSKQCISISSRTPVLIQITECLNFSTNDILMSREQFPVKIFFSKSPIFQISKILISNPKSFNSFSL